MEGVADSTAAPDESGTTGVVTALVVLAVGIGIAAIVDFGSMAGQGVRAGQFVLATAPWVLVLGARRPAPKTRPLEGAVAVSWALLLSGAVGRVAHTWSEGPLWAAPGVIQGLGAVAVLLVIHRKGHLGVLSLCLALASGAVGGTLLTALATEPPGADAVESMSNVLIGGHLTPQLARDLYVVGWATSRDAWEQQPSWRRAQLSLQGVSMPFILWTLAGHLVITPAVLYWNAKPDVLFAGVGAAVAVALFAIRGWAGTYPRWAVAAVCTVAITYGLGLAYMVQGGRPF